MENHTTLAVIEELANQLSAADKVRLIQRLSAQVIEDLNPPANDGDAEEWTPEELEELLSPGEPLTGREIVARGLAGGWKDMGIEDSVAWLEEQRRER